MGAAEGVKHGPDDGPLRPSRAMTRTRVTLAAALLAALLAAAAGPTLAAKSAQEAVQASCGERGAWAGTRPAPALSSGLQFPLPTALNSHVTAMAVCCDGQQPVKPLPCAPSQSANPATPEELTLHSPLLEVRPAAS
jgi:hypothetical protein